MIAIYLVLTLFAGAAFAEAVLIINPAEVLNEMKIPYTIDLCPEDGTDSVERLGDHPDSPHFNRLDVYNLKSTNTLTILESFETQQQTCE